jgi:hypothetical protein
MAGVDDLARPSLTLGNPNEKEPGEISKTMDMLEDGRLVGGYPF